METFSSQITVFGQHHKLECECTTIDVIWGPRICCVGGVQSANYDNGEKQKRLTQNRNKKQHNRKIVETQFEMSTTEIQRKEKM